MLLKEIEVVNLFSFENEIIRFSNHSTIVVGPNNVGKSNLIRIFEILIKALGELKMHDSNFLKRYVDSDLTVRLTFDDEEISCIIDYIYYHYSKFVQKDIKIQKPVLVNLLKEVSLKLKWKDYNYNEKSIDHYLITFDSIHLSLHYDKSVWILIYGSDKFQLNSKFLEFLAGVKSENDFRRRITNFLTKWEKKESILDHLDNLNPSPAKEYQLDRIRKISKYYEHKNFVTTVTLMQLISKILDRQILIKKRTIINDREKIDTTYKLKNDGSNLTVFLYSLQTSATIEDRQLFKQIKDKFEQIFSSNLTFEIIHPENENESSLMEQNSTAKAQKNSVLSLVIVDKKLNKQFLLSETGAGIVEVLFIVSISYGRQKSIIFFDEPASEVHRPLLKLTLNMMIRQSTGNYRNQFIIISHNEMLLHYLIFQHSASIYYVNKTRTDLPTTKFHSLDKDTVNYFESTKLKLSYTLDMRIFFSNVVLLVEGPADYNVFSSIFEFYGHKSEFELDERDISIVQIGGKNNFPKYEKIISSLEIPAILIADLEVLESSNEDIKGIFSDYAKIDSHQISGNKYDRYIIDYKDILKFLYAIDKELYDSVARQIGNINGNKDPMIADLFMKSVLEDPKKKSKAQIFYEIFHRLRNYLDKY